MNKLAKTISKYLTLATISKIHLQILEMINFKKNKKLMLLPNNIKKTNKQEAAHQQITIISKENSL